MQDFLEGCNLNIGALIGVRATTRNLVFGGFEHLRGLITVIWLWRNEHDDTRMQNAVFNVGRKM